MAPIRPEWPENGPPVLLSGMDLSVPFSVVTPKCEGVVLKVLARTRAKNLFRAQLHCQSVAIGIAQSLSPNGKVVVPVWRTTPRLKVAPSSSRNQAKCLALRESTALADLISRPTT